MSRRASLHPATNPPWALLIRHWWTTQEAHCKRDDAEASKVLLYCSPVQVKHSVGRLDRSHQLISPGSSLVIRKSPYGRERLIRRHLATGATYEPYVGHWSRLVARAFVPWLAVPPESRRERRPRRGILWCQRSRSWMLCAHPLRRPACETVAQRTAEDMACLLVTGCGSGSGKRTRDAIGISLPIGSHYV